MYAGFFGVMGASFAMVFSGMFIQSLATSRVLLTHSPIFCLALGAAYGTAKSGVGIANMAIMHPELIMKSIIPVIMAGIIAICTLAGINTAMIHD